MNFDIKETICGIVWMNAALNSNMKIKERSIVLKNALLIIIQTSKTKDAFQNNKDVQF